jgi:hypothetical protein
MLLEFFSIAISIVLALSAVRIFTSLPDMFDPSRGYWAPALAHLQLVSGLVLVSSYLLPWGYESGDPFRGDLLTRLFSLLSPIVFGSFVLPVLFSIAILRSEVVWLRAFLSTFVLASSLGALIVIQGGPFGSSPADPTIWWCLSRYSAPVLGVGSLIQVLLAPISSLEQGNTVSAIISAIAVFLVALGLYALF